MAPPVIRASGVCSISVVDPASLGQLVAVDSGSPDRWLWTAGGTPLGESDIRGVNGDFVEGKAGIANPTFYCVMPGGYTFQVQAGNADGWSAPIVVSFGATTGSIIRGPTDADTAIAAAAAAQATANGAVAGVATLNARTIATTAPLSGGGNLSADRNLGITQATAGTDGYVTLAKYNEWDDKMSNPMTAPGDMIYGGAGLPAVPTRLNVGAATEVMHGGVTPSFSQVVEADLLLADNVTANASVARHGFAPRLSGAVAEYLNGVGAWATPGGVVASYVQQAINVGGGGGNVNVIHGFGAYPLVQVLIAGVVTPPGVGTVTSITHNTVNDFTIAFSGAAVGFIIATIGTPQPQNVVSTAVNYVTTNANHTVRVTVAGVVVTLQPVATAGVGRELIIDNAAAAGNITVDGDGAERIEGELIQTLPPNSAMRIYCDGVGWRFC